MDIKVKTTGKIFHQMAPDLSAVLLELGLVEKVEKVAPAPRENEWGIGKTLSGSVCINLRLPSGELRAYDGFPDTAADGFKTRVWSGAQQEYVLDGPVPPAAILEAYAAQFKPQVYVAGGSMSAYFQARNSKEPSK